MQWCLNSADNILLPLDYAFLPESMRANNTYVNSVVGPPTAFPLKVRCQHTYTSFVGPPPPHFVFFSSSTLFHFPSPIFYIPSSPHVTNAMSTAAAAVSLSRPKAIKPLGRPSRCVVFPRSFLRLKSYLVPAERLFFSFSGCPPSIVCTAFGARVKEGGLGLLYAAVQSPQ